MRIGNAALRAAATAALFEALQPGVAAAQSFAPRESVTVVPGPQYRASSLHRFFFGTRYRALWTTPLRVPVLDLKTFAGGLKPAQKGGGQQTKSLRLTGADGKEYQFRSVDKDPSVVLPPELRETFAAEIVKDQISSGHPAGPLVVDALLDAAGVLHTNHILAVMPDDPALGEFRAEFAGMLGMIEERPKELKDEGATFAGATDIVGTAELYKKLDDDPGARVDAREFLLARLTDVFMGDWDRHDDQWRWALVETAGSRRWLPIPRDRDQAFVRFDGFLLSLARASVPQLVNFGPSYPSIIGATWNGRDLDRRFLTELERPAWDSIAALLKSRLTDAAIEKAVLRLPPQYQPLDGPRLGRALRARRDRLDWIAGKFYELLSGQVEVYGTDKDDHFRAERKAAVTEVTLSHKGQEYFHRRFNEHETTEIRIRLQGGDDHAVIEGEGGNDPTIRVIGGGGDDEYKVTASGGVHLYDDRGENHAKGARINRKPWHWKPDSTKANELPPRDWGSKTVTAISGSYGPDVLAVLGYGGYTDWYGFRRLPYANRLDYRLEIATGEASGRATAGYTRQFENSQGFVGIEAMASGIENLRWYGFGNERVQTQAVSFYRVTQNEFSGSVKLGFRIGKRSEFSLGPLVRWSNTDPTEKHNAVRFIAVDKPYGVGKFGTVGARARLKVEGRDHPHFASKGGAFTLQASGFPAVWDARTGLLRLEGEGSVSVAPQGKWRPSLTLMAGGVKTWGDSLPFFIAPTLGGVHTLRGYRPDRFAGDASVYGAAELRIPVSHLKLIVPGDQGFFGFLDGGRVFLRGESSTKWHSSLGGGVWTSFMTRDNVLYVGVAQPTKDKEGTRLVLGFGFPY